jgi:hypothetical protein
VIGGWLHAAGPLAVYEGAEVYQPEDDPEEKTGQYDELKAAPYGSRIRAKKIDFKVPCRRIVQMINGGDKDEKGQKHPQWFEQQGHKIGFLHTWGPPADKPVAKGGNEPGQVIAKEYGKQNDEYRPQYIAEGIIQDGPV